MLRKGAGSEVTKANLKRMAGKQKDTSRGAKLTAKSVNVNYVTQRTAALPPAVKLTYRDAEKSLPEQLKDILSEYSVRLIDLFREWDDDGNGALDKKEVRRAVAALGYEAPRSEVDALFDSIDVDKGGMIEFEEFKKALSKKGVDAAKKAHDAKRQEKAKSDAMALELSLIHI